MPGIFGALRCWPALLSAVTVLAVLVGSAVPAALAAGSVASVAASARRATTRGDGGVAGTFLAGRRSLGYAPASRKGSVRLSYTISGNAATTLYPGTSSAIDLSFHNPNPAPLTISAGSIRITSFSSRRSCPSNRNLEVVHTLTASVTIPGGTTTTLAALGVPSADWPLIAMKDTAFTQDACAGATFQLRYAAGGGSGRQPHVPPPHGPHHAAAPIGRAGS